MKLISEIADDILKDLHGSIRFERERSVVEAITEIAKRSGVFKFTTEHTITAGDVDTFNNNSVSLYPDEVPDYHPWRIDKLWIDGSQKSLYRRAIVSNLSDFDKAYHSGLAYYNIAADGSVILFPFPTETAFSGNATGILPVVMEAVYYPDSAITEIDDFFYLRWRGVVEAGAKALMMGQPGKPWTNPGLSKILLDQFQAGINGALIKRNLEEHGGELFAEKIQFI